MGTERRTRHEIKTMLLKDLKPAPYNPRKISPQALKGLTASIKRFGLVQPIILNARSGFVVGGHQRIEAMKATGEKDAQVLVVDLPDEEERALNVTLNSPAISGTFTDELQPILDDIRESLPHDFVDLRLDDLLSDSLSTATGNEDEAPAVPKQTSCKTGDAWILGDHRLVCGDSSKEQVFDKLLGKERVDLCFTDPPYGIDYGAKNRMLNSFQKAGRNLKDIANDVMGKDGLYRMLVSTFTLAREHSASHCSYYVTSPQGGELGLMMMMMMTAGLPVKHVLIWVKDSQNFSLGRLDYEYQHEPILFSWNKSHRFYAGGEMRSSVWEVAKPRSSSDHPTMKPVELIQNALLNSSKRGDVVLDMFAGSGSTMIACERTQRKARCIELDPAYCDVIMERWQRFTGRKARKA